MNDQSDRPVAVAAAISPDLVLTTLRAGWVLVPVAPGLWQRAAGSRHRAGVEDGTIAVLPDGAPPGYAFTWWSPAPRFAVPAGAARTNRKVRALIRRESWHSTVNAAFTTVVEECRRDREPRWITDDYVDTLSTLHTRGHAYSIEIWDGTDLVAGGFGTLVGRVASVDSHFFRRTGASKVCLLDAAARATEAGAHLLDLQWPTDHGAEIGGRPIPAEDLHTALQGAGPVTLPPDRRPVTHLLQC